MKLVEKLTKIYMIPLAALLVFLFFCSLTQTTVTALYQDNEHPSYMKDPVLLMLLVLALSLVLLYVICRYVIRNQKIRTGSLRAAALVWAAAWCLFAVYVFRCGVSSDGMNVNILAGNLLDGDYQAILDNPYFQVYPYQIYMAEFFAFVYRIIGRDNYIVFQLMNAVLIILAMLALQKITDEIFKGGKETACKTAGAAAETGTETGRWLPVISMLYIPLFLFSALIYGDVISLCLGLWAIFFTLRYLQTDRWQYLIPTAALFCLAVITKENTKIMLMAFFIIMVLKTFTDRRWLRLVLAGAVVVIGLSGTFTIRQAVTRQMGLDSFPEGTPLLSWVVMGVQDTDESGVGCGWFNGFTSNVYEESGRNPELAAELSKEALKEAISFQLQHPKHMIYYYYKKFISSWNDSSFMIQQLNEWNSRHSENKIPLSDVFIYGSGYTFLFWLMNFCHLIVTFFVAIGGIAVLRKWSLPAAYLLLNVTGGVLFHEFVWETSGRYVHPYYVMLMPVAAYGCCVFYRWAGKIKIGKNEYRSMN